MSSMTCIPEEHRTDMVTLSMSKGVASLSLCVYLCPRLTYASRRRLSVPCFRPHLDSMVEDVGTLEALDLTHVLCETLLLCYLVEPF
jgi:hypothetical protein